MQRVVANPRLPVWALSHLDQESSEICEKACGGPKTVTKTSILVTPTDTTLVCNATHTDCVEVGCPLY